MARFRLGGSGSRPLLTFALYLGEPPFAGGVASLPPVPAPDGVHQSRLSARVETRRRWLLLRRTSCHGVCAGRRGKKHPGGYISGKSSKCVHFAEPGKINLNLQ
jgi:hypothetical protein